MKDNVKPKIEEFLKMKVKSKEGEEKSFVVSNFSEKENREKNVNDDKKSKNCNFIYNSR